MQPRSDGGQRCSSFDLSIKPRASVGSYHDHLGNLVHHFDIPGHHTNLSIKAEARVEIAPQTPPTAMKGAAWNELDELLAEGRYWEMLAPSRFATSTDLLRKLAADLSFQRRDDPLSLLRELTARLHDGFEYAPQSTEVDSPIDEALLSRRGVCQDLAHIMITLVRGVNIPCRYVSGYLFHRAEDQDRSAADATHAWVEARLPGLGWVGFDPTNNLIAGERHIRVAIGRDYSDVPPTRGVFKGDANGELSVSVQVAPADEILLDEMPTTSKWLAADRAEVEQDYLQQQQQQ